jgi:hypothetical protein
LADLAAEQGHVLALANNATPYEYASGIGEAFLTITLS